MESCSMHICSFITDLDSLAFWACFLTMYPKHKNQRSCFSLFVCAFMLLCLYDRLFVLLSGIIHFQLSGNIKQKTSVFTIMAENQAVHILTVIFDQMKMAEFYAYGTIHCIICIRTINFYFFQMSNVLFLCVQFFQIISWSHLSLSI